MRRSELVGLDWMKQGEGNGFVAVEPKRGIVVTLSRSKNSQDKKVIIVVPCTDMPVACFWPEQWAKVAKLEAGQPIFRAVDQPQNIGADRLTNRSVSRIERINKARVRAWAMLTGKSAAEAELTNGKMAGSKACAGGGPRLRPWAVLAPFASASRHRGARRDARRLSRHRCARPAARPRLRS